MLLDRSNWPSHRPWFYVFLLGTVASMAWFCADSRGSPQWPGGSSVPGFTFGVVGGLIVLFEFLLWCRKKVRVWRIGSAQTWLRAHIWLGLLCLPLLVLHSGLRLGGTLSTVLMVLLVIVIVSGIGGLILQNMLPRRALEAMPAETVYSQMDYLVGQLLAEAERLVSKTCGIKAEDLTPIAEGEALALFYREQVAPFLRQGTTGNSPLCNASRAAELFQNCKMQLPPAAHEALAALESFCEQRRQWDSQVHLHFWLHSWLWVHFPLSVALLVLMVAHVVVSLRYW